MRDELPGVREAARSAMRRAASIAERVAPFAVGEGEAAPTRKRRRARRDRAAAAEMRAHRARLEHRDFEAGHPPACGACAPTLHYWARGGGGVSSMCMSPVALLRTDDKRAVSPIREVGSTP